MGVWLIAILLLVAMAVSLFLGLWLFVPVLLVAFFALLIHSWTRRGVRREA
jgi:hypothetical protein